MNLGSRYLRIFCPIECNTFPYPDLGSVLGHSLGIAMYATCHSRIQVTPFTDTYSGIFYPGVRKERGIYPR